MNYKTFFRLELKNFLGSRAVSAAFFCIALAGIYAVYHGRNVIEKQRILIAQVDELQTEHTKKILSFHPDSELADVLYYHFFNTVHTPSSWSPFSVGQRDVNPFNMKVRMLALENQIYDSELNNPTNLLFGNFDLSFVIVFLFPLLIVAFTHNILSAEEESGTWNLLRAQPVSALKILFLRLALRFSIIALASFLLIFIGAFFIGAKFDERFLYAVLLSVFYIAFWFGVSALVISFKRSSNFNALTLLGIWVFLALLAPALLSTLLATVLPVSESMETAVENREGYHEKWDKPKAETMEKFYRKYPEYRTFPISEDKFSWGWYYAMQNAGDEDSADASRKFAEKLAKRQHITEKISWFLPTVNTQLEFNGIAQTDIGTHLNYLDSVRNYHEKIRTSFYPAIFRNDKVSEADLKKIQINEFKDENAQNQFPKGVLAILVWTILLCFGAYLNFQKKEIL